MASIGVTEYELALLVYQHLAVRKNAFNFGMVEERLPTKHTHNSRGKTIPWAKRAFAEVMLVA